jgi:hypothetical protein
MGKSNARPGGRKSPSANQRKATKQPAKPLWRKPAVWLGTLGTGVLIGVLVNVLSSQAERVVPPPSSASSSAAPHLEVDGVSLTDPGAPVKFTGPPFTPFKVDIKLLNTGKGLAIINSVRLIIQEFVLLPLCNSQGSFGSTGAYRANMPINARPGQVVNIPVSQLVEPNGADRFDLLLRTPLLQGNAKFNIYLYRVRLFLLYNVHTKPLDVGEVLVDLPVAPDGGEYYWNSYYSAHPQGVKANVTAGYMPQYKKCVVTNSHALHSILSLSARQSPELATILPTLRYRTDMLGP